MVTINIAYTSPINKGNATPALTRAQVWEGLKLKVRQPQDFIPAISACEVIAEEALSTGELQITRQLKFVPGRAHKDRGVIQEICVHHAPCRVDFHQEDGTTITSVISTRPDGEPLLGDVFEWRHPDVQEGSEAAAQLEADHWKMAKMSVEGTIDAIRRLVSEGKIQ
ncbi:hypothetical protein GGR50DRAFT_37224 [Xylaria sp. CBS 124048]|nr:hypothetical protein GGR50DRAFT_37224 [Xylaria sp. CBS 124048]